MRWPRIVVIERDDCRPLGGNYDGRDRDRGVTFMKRNKSDVTKQNKIGRIRFSRLGFHEIARDRVPDMLRARRSTGLG